MAKRVLCWNLNFNTFLFYYFCSGGTLLFSWLSATGRWQASILPTCGLIMAALSLIKWEFRLRRSLMSLTTFTVAPCFNHDDYSSQDYNQTHMEETCLGCCMAQTSKQRFDLYIFAQFILLIDRPTFPLNSKRHESSSLPS